MILVCSAGHKTDLDHPFNWHKKLGDRCNQLMSYDIMIGSKYCQRKLYSTIPKTTKDIVFEWLSTQDKGRRFTVKMLWISVFNRKVTKGAISKSLHDLCLDGTVKRCEVMVGRNSTWIKR